eukprot:bmy_05548T0
MFGNMITKQENKQIQNPKIREQRAVNIFTLSKLGVDGVYFESEKTLENKLSGLLAARDVAGSAEGGHAQIRALLVVSDYVPDAGEGGPGVLVDAGPHVGSGQLSRAGPLLRDRHDPFASRRRLHAHSLAVNCSGRSCGPSGYWARGPVSKMCPKPTPPPPPASPLPTGISPSSARIGPTKRPRADTDGKHTSSDCLGRGRTAGGWTGCCAGGAVPSRTSAPAPRPRPDAEGARQARPPRSSEKTAEGEGSTLDPEQLLRRKQGGKALKWGEFPGGVDGSLNESGNCHRHCSQTNKVRECSCKGYWKALWVGGQDAIFRKISIYTYIYAESAYKTAQHPAEQCRAPHVPAVGLITIWSMEGTGKETPTYHLYSRDTKCNNDKVESQKTQFLFDLDSCHQYQEIKQPQEKTGAAPSMEHMHILGAVSKKAKPILGIFQKVLLQHSRLISAVLSTGVWSHNQRKREAIGLLRAPSLRLPRWYSDKERCLGRSISRKRGKAEEYDINNFQSSTTRKGAPRAHIATWRPTANQTWRHQDALSDTGTGLKADWQEAPVADGTARVSSLCLDNAEREGSSAERHPHTAPLKATQYPWKSAPRRNELDHYAIIKPP